MLPSNTNNANNTTSVSYNTSPLPFYIDITPNSKQEDPLLSLFHFPSPFFHYEDDAGVFFPHHHDLLQLPPKQQPLLTTDINSAPHETLQVNNILFDSNKDSAINEIMGNSKKKTSHRAFTETPRKRSSKRDRHSKINTAQGPRDRRMRLSLDIARQFFDLQDMLGYDKASKTVEWLLFKAKAEIKKLRGGLAPTQMKGSCSVGCTTKSASSTSEGEVVSGLIDEATVPINGNNQISKALKPSTACVTKEKRIRQSRKPAFHTLARESREKARARARERTKEKMMLSSRRSSALYESTTNQDLNQVGNSWSPFEESGSQSHNNMNPLMEVLQADQVEEPSSHEFEGQQLGTTTTAGDMGDEPLASMGKWSPSPIPHYLHNSTGIFQEVSSNKKFSDLPNIDSARTYTTSSYCATTSMHLSITGNDQDGIPNPNFLTAPYDCLQHQFADFDDQF